MISRCAGQRCALCCCRCDEQQAGEADPIAVQGHRHDVDLNGMLITPRMVCRWHSASGCALLCRCRRSARRPRRADGRPQQPLPRTAAPRQPFWRPSTMRRLALRRRCPWRCHRRKSAWSAPRHMAVPAPLHTAACARTYMHPGINACTRTRDACNIHEACERRHAAAMHTRLMCVMTAAVRHSSIQKRTRPRPVAGPPAKQAAAARL